MADSVTATMKDRLKRLEDNATELAAMKVRHSLEDIKADKSLEWALRYGLLESFQIVIDIACHIVSKYNLGNPESYSDCIALLAEHKYIDRALAEKLTGMVGLRDILVHHYVVIEVERLYNLLTRIDDLRQFARAVLAAL